MVLKRGLPGMKPAILKDQFSATDSQQVAFPHLKALRIIDDALI